MGRGIVCRIFDVNEAGVGFVAPEDVKVGADVEVELAGLPSRSGKRVTSVVRHVDPSPDGFIVGCEFERRIKPSDFMHLLK
jgi:hypothetical protein